MDFKVNNVEKSIHFIKGRGKTIPAHIHYHAEILYLVHGQVSLMIDNRGYELKDGDLALVMPNEIHSVGGSSDADYMIIQFSPDILPDLKRKLNECMLKNSVVNEQKLSSLSISMLQTLDREYTEDIEKFNQDYPKQTAKGIIMVLLPDMLAHNTILRKIDKNKIPMCQTVVNYVEQHYREDLSLSYLADMLGLNKSYLSRAFSANLNISLTEYITNRRLEYAENRIRQSAESITDILYDAGFSSERTFYRCFKKRYGFTPARLREHI